MARTEEEIQREQELWDEFERNFFGEPVEERAAEIREWVDRERARRKRLAKEHPEQWVEAKTTHNEMLAWIRRSREARRRGCPVGTVTIESEENDDWIRTEETRESEARIHDQLAEEHEEED